MFSTKESLLVKAAWAPISDLVGDLEGKLLCSPYVSSGWIRTSKGYGLSPKILTFSIILCGQKAVIQNMILSLHPLEQEIA